MSVWLSDPPVFDGARGNKLGLIAANAIDTENVNEADRLVNTIEAGAINDSSIAVHIPPIRKSPTNLLSSIVLLISNQFNKQCLRFCWHYFFAKF